MSKEIKGRTVGTYRTALFWIFSDEMRKFLHSPQSNKLFSGFTRLRPSMPRLPGIVWDINQVLNYIKTLPHNKDLTLMQLSAKTVFLLLICTTRRPADVMAIHTGFIFKDANRFVCQLQNLSKTYSLTNTSVQNLEVVRFPQDPQICPYKALSWYLYRTKSLRRSCKWLFVTTTDHTEAAPTTISHWVKNIMSEAGIDKKLYKPHSTRAASSSFLLSSDMPLDDILKKGCWLTPSVFKSHYARIVGHISTDRQKGLLPPSTVPPSSTSAGSRGTLHNISLPAPVISNINNLPSSSPQVKDFVKQQAPLDNQHPQDTEVAPMAAPPLSRPPPLLEPLAALDDDFELPLSPLGTDLTDFDDHDSIISSLFDQAEIPVPDVQEVTTIVGPPPTDSSQDLVDEHFRRALDNINNPVTVSSNLVRSLPPPAPVPSDPISPPPQFRDPVAIQVAVPQPPVTPVVNLLDDGDQPLFTVPPNPPSTLENICDQILMPPPPPLKKGGAVRIIAGKQKAGLNTTKLRIAGGVVKISKPTSVSLLKPDVIEAIAKNRPSVEVDSHKQFSRSAAVVTDMQNLDSFLPVDPVHLRLIMSLNFREMININLNAADGTRPLVGIAVPAPRVFQFQKAGYTIISDPAQPQAFLVVLSQSDLATIQSSNLNP